MTNWAVLLQLFSLVHAHVFMNAKWAKINSDKKRQNSANFKLLCNYRPESQHKRTDKLQIHNVFLVTSAQSLPNFANGRTFAFLQKYNINTRVGLPSALRNKKYSIFNLKLFKLYFCNLGCLVLVNRLVEQSKLIPAAVWSIPPCSVWRREGGRGAASPCTAWFGGFATVCVATVCLERAEGRPPPRSFPRQSAGLATRCCSPADGGMSAESAVTRQQFAGTTSHTAFLSYNHHLFGKILTDSSSYWSYILSFLLAVLLPVHCHPSPVADHCSGTPAAVLQNCRARLVQGCRWENSARMAGMPPDWLVQSLWDSRIQVKLAACRNLKNLQIYSAIRQK